jgi:5'-methylthioadenosine phosphorylase
MEGPQFSTRAESRLYRSWGADIIGMTALPEAKLAREAEICYATLAFASDYDCWHPDYDTVTTRLILSNMQKGIDTAKSIIRLTLPSLPQVRTCPCASALKDAIITSPKYIPEKTKGDLALLIEKYLNGKENAS